MFCHLAYTGSLLTLVGLGLFSRTWEGTLAVAVLFGLVYDYRISAEEKELKAEFPRRARRAVNSERSPCPLAWSFYGRNRLIKTMFANIAMPLTTIGAA